MNPSALWLPGRFKPHTEITSSKLAFLPCAIEVVVVVLSRDFIKTRERERLLIRLWAYEITRDVVTGSADYSCCATSSSCLPFYF